MLRALLIGPESEIVKDLKENLAGMPGLSVSQQVERYPDRVEMGILLRQLNPDAVLLNLADYQRACQLIGHLGALRPQVPVIAVHSFCDRQVLLELRHQGVRELWFPPFQVEQMQHAVQRLLQHKLAAAHHQAGAGTLIAFLPARGGCGATTVAVNTAAALARNKHAVLLADFDLHNSVIAFWLKLEPKYTLREAIERADRLEECIWRNLVESVRGVDILCTPPPGTPMVLSGGKTFAILEYARQNYQFALVDLPDTLFTSCWDVLENSKHIMLVVTPEMGSLHLARRKLDQLQNYGIPKSNIHLLLNRCSHLDIQPAEVAKFFGMPILAIFGNDYRAVNNSFKDAKFSSDGSKLGAQYTSFARYLAGEPDFKEAKAGVSKIRRIFSV
ncbi:MAG: AAA family ATPase [Acidobacteria bacterium]|nr:AAA family ATPase [Acidobacteriota bacterium]